jgi:hypothetical protein
MSYLHFKSTFDHGAYTNGNLTPPIMGEMGSQGPAADCAIDSALRSVPLPDGFLTRLGKLVYTMPDEAADQVDWLGC